MDVSFVADGILDDLPLPTQIGATRVGGIDLNTPRMRAALAAALALTAAPGGFTVAQFTDKIHAMTGQTDYTTRQGAYDLRKLRGKKLITKTGRSHRYHTPLPAARTIARIDRDYEQTRIDMHTLFHDLAITAQTAA